MRSGAWLLRVPGYLSVWVVAALCALGAGCCGCRGGAVDLLCSL